MAKKTRPTPPAKPPKNLLADTFAFLEMLNGLRLIRRTVLCKDSDLEENDMEHSYQLAMLAWFLIDRAKLSLDTGRAIRYALAHDVLEVYAGDTPVFNINAGETKADRERRAIERLTKEWGKKFPDFIQAIKDYEARKDEEAIFVYALDKMIAPINIHLGGGRSWKEHKVTFDMMLVEKLPKLKDIPFAAGLFDEFVSVAGKSKHLFHGSQ